MYIEFQAQSFYRQLLHCDTASGKQLVQLNETGLGMYAICCYLNIGRCVAAIDLPALRALRVREQYHGHHNSWSAIQCLTRARVDHFQPSAIIILSGRPDARGRSRRAKDTFKKVVFYTKFVF